jgi:hypothetical protein
MTRVRPVSGLFQAAWVGAALGLAPLAAAQRDLPPLPERPAAEPIPPKRPPDKTPVAPATPQAPDVSIPGITDEAFEITPAPMRAEGTFLVDQRGSILKLPSGEYVFVFHADENDKRERPMVLAPSTTLQRMERARAERGDQTVFLVSGEVLAYNSVNYLLPGKFSILSASAANAASKHAQPSAAPGVEPNRDPAVADLIRRLEAQRDQMRAPMRTGGASPGEGSSADQAAGTASVALIPEDQMILRRRGRLVRTTQGQWALMFDNGLGRAGASDPPLLVVPCWTLQRMEGWTAIKGEGATFEVSGRVLAYHGRDYLLPTMYQVYPQNDLEPRQ